MENGSRRKGKAIIEGRIRKRCESGPLCGNGQWQIMKKVTLLWPPWGADADIIFMAAVCNRGRPL